METGLIVRTKRVKEDTRRRVWDSSGRQDIRGVLAHVWGAVWGAHVESDVWRRVAAVVGRGALVWWSVVGGTVGRAVGGDVGAVPVGWHAVGRWHVGYSVGRLWVVRVVCGWLCEGN